MLLFWLTLSTQRKMYRVSELVKKKNNYSISIDCEDTTEVYSVSEDFLVEHKIYAGKEFSQNEHNKLLKSINQDKLYQKVLNYALFKPRTKYEITGYLNKNKISNPDFFINKLIRVKLIDDKKYAEIFIQDSISFKRLGPKKIENELKLKGIDFNLIYTLMEGYNHIKILENLEFWYDKKIQTIKAKSLLQTQKNLFDFLVNKGFSFEDVNYIISYKSEQLKSTLDEDKTILDEIKVLRIKYNKNKPKVSANQYITNKLLSKGFSYSLIKKYLKEEICHE